MDSTTPLAAVQPPDDDEEPAPKIALRPGFRADVSGRSLEMFFCMEQDGNMPRAFFLTGVSPRHRTICCPLCGGEEHDTVGVMEAFEEGWINVDADADGNAVTLSIESRDLFLAVLREQVRAS